MVACDSGNGPSLGVAVVPTNANPYFESLYQSWQKVFLRIPPMLVLVGSYPIFSHPLVEIFSRP